MPQGSQNRLCAGAPCIAVSPCHLTRRGTLSHAAHSCALRTPLVHSSPNPSELVTNFLVRGAPQGRSGTCVTIPLCLCSTALQKKQMFWEDSNEGTAVGHPSIALTVASVKKTCIATANTFTESMRNSFMVVYSSIAWAGQLQEPGLDFGTHTTFPCSSTTWAPSPVCIVQQRACWKKLIAEINECREPCCSVGCIADKSKA